MKIIKHFIRDERGLWFAWATLEDGSVVYKRILGYEHSQLCINGWIFQRIGFRICGEKRDEVFTQ